MAGARLADMIIPDVFAEYMIEKTNEKSALLQSGILYTDTSIKSLANGGGEFVNMPFFNDLTGEAEAGGIGFDGTALTPAKITTNQDVAVKVFRAKAWDASDFSAMLSGADPMGAIASRVADFWVREEQRVLLSSLKGVFTTALASTHVHDISALTGGAQIIGASSTVDAIQKLGDIGSEIAGIAMHSATFYTLVKQQLIVNETTADKQATFPTYLGKRVIVDDSLPVSSGTYTTFLFGKGAIGYANIGVKTPIETDRDTLGGVDALITRKGFVMHTRGVKWGVTTPNPTNAQLETGANWSKVYENKSIRVISFKHKLA